jgi:integrase
MSTARRPADSGRASNNRSSIYRGGDGRWHGRITMGVKNDGSPDRRHVTGKTEKAVTEKVRKLEAERDAGNAANAGRAPTVEQWATTYLTDIAPAKISPKTLDAYWSLVRNWIIPHLGKHRLDRLQPEHLDKLYATMAAAGKAPSSVLKTHRILSRMLKVAHRRGKVGRNVATLVDAPSVREVEIQPFTREEARRVLSAAEGRRNGVRWSVGLALGLRQGEALGLRWAYVDLDKRTIKVWWQLQRLSWRHGCVDPHACGKDWHRPACPLNCTQHRHGPRCAPSCRKRSHVCPKTFCRRSCTGHAQYCPKRQGGGIVFREPKAKSKRVVMIPPELVPLLRLHRAAQLAERLHAGSAWEDHDVLFAQPNGRPVDPRDDWEEWKGLLRGAGVRDARVHDGRHTAATLLIEQGVHVRVVQEILGHSDIRQTQRYAHVASSAAQDAASRMGKLLWGR